jgi:hypothetical protein
MQVLQKTQGKPIPPWRLAIASCGESPLFRVLEADITFRFAAQVSRITRRASARTARDSSRSASSRPSRRRPRPSSQRTPRTLTCATSWAPTGARDTCTRTSSSTARTDNPWALFRSREPKEGRNMANTPFRRRRGRITASQKTEVRIPVGNDRTASRRRLSYRRRTRDNLRIRVKSREGGLLSMTICDSRQ